MSHVHPVAIYTCTNSKLFPDNLSDHVNHNYQDIDHSCHVEVSCLVLFQARQLADMRLKKASETTLSTSTWGHIKQTQTTVTAATSKGLYR